MKLDEKTLEKFGYTIESLSQGSHKLIVAQCDYCGDEYYPIYKNYLSGINNNPIKKDACKKCRFKKREECNTINYGGNPSTLPEVKEKIKNTLREKYGVDHPSHNSEFKKKVRQKWGNKSEDEINKINQKRQQTTLEKYGITLEEYLQQKREEAFLKKYGVPYLPVTEEIKEKRRQTMLDKYGTDNINEVPEIKEKITQSNLEKYGVKSIFQSEEFKEKMRQQNLEKYGVEHATQREDIKEKTRRTNLEKYGVEYVTQNPEIKKKAIQTRVEKNLIKLYNGKRIIDWAKEAGFSRTHAGVLLKKYGADIFSKITKFKTSLEQELETILKKYNINYQVGPIIGKRRGDFLLCDYNIIIEADGLYWHSEINKHRKYHYEKRQFYLENNLTPLFFREDEIIFKKTIVESIILNKINKIPNKIYARNCIIQKVDKQVARQFLLENHLMGPSNGQCFGLFYNNELVSLIQMRKYSGETYEIARFCHKNFYTVVGGLSKLIKTAQEIFNFKQLITYIDLRYGNGNYLINFGFEKQSENISFAWTKSHISIHRLNLTDKQAKEQGFYKIYDCGQALYIKNYS